MKIGRSFYGRKEEEILLCKRRKESKRPEKEILLRKEGKEG